MQSPVPISKYDPDSVNWTVMRKAFELVQTRLARRSDRNYTDDQLFDVLKTTYEFAMGATRPDLFVGQATPCDGRKDSPWYAIQHWRNCWTVVRGDIAGDDFERAPGAVRMTKDAADKLADDLNQSQA